MADLTLLNAMTLVALSISLSFLVLWLSGLVWQSSSVVAPAMRPALKNAVFLFKDDTLLDHDAPGFTLPAGAIDSATDWQRFREWLGHRFGDLPDHLSELPNSLVTRVSRDVSPSNARLEIEQSGQSVRISIHEEPLNDAVSLHKSHQKCAFLERQAGILSTAPLPVWICDDAGVIVWQNVAAQDLEDEIKFGLIDMSQKPAPTQSDEQHLSLPAPGSMAELHYELRVTGLDRGTVYYAKDISRIIRAETLKREFVQTLSKTFANLTVGLTIFDRNRKLVLFNPAVLDLTSLSPEFLSSGPNLLSFFDALRNRQVMPEPKNYANWRTQINEMVKTAKGGFYEEVWSLALGKTYRVTGRPHPDGAVAFLFEDISVEISKMRQNRMQTDVRQAVLDRLAEGIAVLSTENRLIFCNRKLEELVGIDPKDSFAELSLRDVISASRARFPDDAIWGKIEETALGSFRSEPLLGHVESSNHGSYILRLEPIGKGLYLLRMTPQNADLPMMMASNSR